jgi:hypothetical protein
MRQVVAEGPVLDTLLSEQPSARLVRPATPLERLLGHAADGGAVVDEGGPALADGGAVLADGGAVVDEGGPALADGGAVLADGGAVVDGGGAVLADGGTALEADGPP